MSTAIQTTIATDTRPSLKRIAKIAGIFYLFVAVFGGFSQVVLELTHVAGNAAATVDNLVAKSTLVQLGSSPSSLTPSSLSSPRWLSTCF